MSLFARIVIGFGFAGLAGASPILWNLSGVTLADGGVATGSFMFDADTSLYSSVDITTSGGSIAGTTYLDVVTGPAVGSFILAAAPVASYGIGTQSFLIQYSSALTDAGGTAPITTGAEGPCQDSQCDVIDVDRFVTAGAVTTNAVPEPSSVGLFALGLGLLGLGLVRGRFASSASLI